MKKTKIILWILIVTLMIGSFVPFSYANDGGQTVNNQSPTPATEATGEPTEEPTAEPATAEPEEEPETERYTGSGLTYADLLKDPSFNRTNTYAYYRNSSPSTAAPIREYIIDASKPSNATGTYEIYKDYEGDTGDSIFADEDSKLEYTFEVEEAGLYSIQLRYFPIEGKGADIERVFKINGELPFFDASQVVFSRVWVDNTAKMVLNTTTGEYEFKSDNRGNNIKPTLIEAPEWRTEYVMDTIGYYIDPYQFYFEKGTNTITIEGSREPIVISEVIVLNEEKLKTYNQIKAEYDSKGYKPVSSSIQYYQAESAYQKSSTMLTAQTNRSSASVEPYNVSKTMLNTIGGTTWNISGQWITWNFTVPEDGLYTITLKSRQTDSKGAYTCRELRIDGEVPFEECKILKFESSNDFVNKTLGDEENGNYQFYFTAGTTHTLTLTATLGDLAYLLIEAEESVNMLNVAYRKILMITGNTPDTYRDYKLDQKLPGVLTVFQNEVERMTTMSANIESLTGKKGDKAAILDSFSYQLRDFIKDVDTIPKRLSALKSNIGSLSTWLTTMAKQPLSMDYFVIASEDEVKNIKPANAGFFKQFAHEIGAFIASFFEDYNTIGNTYESNKSIRVWITTGRDQANVLKQLIDDDFVPSKGISVNLQLVNPTVLLPAVVAGVGPDVAIQVANTEPVNYAIRGAVHDLTQFDDFEEIKSRFHQSAVTPLEYNGGVYALPETESFSLLFYRTDIFEELGLEVPQTWQDVIEILPELMKNNMTFGLTAADVNTYAMFLFQNGAQLYSDSSTRALLDSEEAIAAFKRYTNFYISYDLELTFDFTNRFRIGEMPIGIADYSLYNTLSVFAPEIRGRWNFALVPGTMSDDGNIVRSNACAGVVSMIIEASENKEEAWEFLKWWTSADIQTQYGNGMESIMGSAARYNTANLDAVQALAWSTKDLNKLNEQWSWVKGVPQIPGSYFLSRHLTNAFRKVVYDKVDPRETLLEYLRTINEEITNKREEYDLITYEQEKAQGLAD